MSQNFTLATLTAAGTFAIGTFLQHADPRMSAAVSGLVFLIYRIGSNWIDEQLA